MKAFKNISFISLTIIFLVVLFQCTSVPKLEKETPFIIETAYYQKWSAGTKEGGSGINLYIETKDTLKNLDSIYFRGQVVKLQPKPNNSLLYIGRFKSNVKTHSWSFQIQDDECVVSYLEHDKVHYFKISNILEHKPLNYPHTSSNR
ncbi:hypothetical protein [Winogradskyella forsetii]|uniref:hypothetical protein n=1 Tax=Winogradskyella forsetii TaxID=2686077 RepID=UPI0015BC84E2|nr:hypothetical protein [Winogradskyella forsetii]